MTPTLLPPTDSGVKAVDVPGFGRLYLGEVLAAAKGSKVCLHV